MSGTPAEEVSGAGSPARQSGLNSPFPTPTPQVADQSFLDWGGGDPHSSRDARDQRWKVGEPGPPGGVGRETRRGEQSTWVNGWMCRWPPGGARGGDGAGVRAAAGAGSPAPQLPRTLAHPGEHRPASTPARHGARALGRKVPQPPGGGEPGPAGEAQ